MILTVTCGAVNMGIKFIAPDHKEEKFYMNLCKLMW